MVENHNEYYGESDEEVAAPMKTKKKKPGLMARLVVFVIIVAGIIIASTIYLSPSEAPRKADAIVAISGGDTYTRTMKAVDLYHAGWSSRIIFSGAARDPRSPSNAEVMKQIAMGNGVPLSAIQTDKQARNTAQNASGSRDVLSSDNYKNIILVTSQYHQRRAAIQFGKIFGPNVHIINQPANDYYWNRWSWWTSPQGWYITLSELIKIPIVMARGY